MSQPSVLDAAIADLCDRFERYGYNPTPVIDLGVLVANADGTVDEHELATLRMIFEQSLGEKLNAELVSYLIEASRDVIEEAGIGPRLRLLAEILKDCDAVEPGLLLALIVAYASEGLSASERTLITELADATGLESSRLEELIETVRVAMESEDAPVPSRRMIGAG